MATVEELRARFEKAEAEAQKVMADKDDALAKVRDRYAEKLREATDHAAERQKEWLDAEAAAALVGRDDAEAVARTLGLTLPDDA
jgi:hypothetical protein